MANTTISAAAANAACNAIVDLIDASSPTPGTFKIIQNNQAQPASPDVSLTGTVLVTITLSDPAFGVASSGTATASGTPKTQAASNTGTAAWFRVSNGSGTAIIDGDVSTSGADLNLNSTSIQSGADVELTSWTFSVPQS